MYNKMLLVQCSLPVQFYRFYAKKKINFGRQKLIANINNSHSLNTICRKVYNFLLHYLFTISLRFSNTIFQFEHKHENRNVSRDTGDSLKIKLNNKFYFFYFYFVK